MNYSVTGNLHSHALPPSSITGYVPFSKYFKRCNAVTRQTEQAYTSTDTHMDVCTVICTHETQLHTPLLQSLSLCIQNPFTHFLWLRTVCSGRMSD